MSSEIWIRTDESEDVAACVRHVLRCWTVTSEDAQVWRWVALALHAALQGACVGHLVTTAKPIGAVTDRNAKEWMEYLDKSRLDRNAEVPKTQLMNLPDLLKAVRKSGAAGSGGETPGIRISDQELRWLRRFHDGVRNQFIHFEPMGWSIEVSGLPGLSKLVSRIVGEILDAGWAFRHKDAGWREALRIDLVLLSSLEIASSQ